MKELSYLFEAFGNLATWVKVVILFLLATTIIGATAFFDRRIALIVAAGLFILALLLIAYALLIRAIRKHQAAVLSGEIVSQAGHRGIVDPAARGRLEDLQRTFAQGLEKFSLAGKDLYRMPWFVIVGEPGSGKSEAIRRCEVGFPPGMQDEYQGVGGTVNMNWWFTNHAVILDTAGRLMFEEVEPGATSEWQAFLGLLHKHRFHCPINGLLLSISVESLIHDSPEKMERKAARIAQQLEVIRRELDIRFPVFVLLTKADLISGFREFFDDIYDAKTQQQMLGWSNPAPLDAPFRPELVDEHLGTVVDRLRLKRFRLLANPSPVQPGGRRINEVDRLYQFPQNLGVLGPRLRRYLETIFVAGEWSARPLFLRGIYFTSAMREGAELDEDIAQALGIRIESLTPVEERVWERDRSFFLRDLFLDKIFREDGLVTRASKTNRIVYQRQLMVFASGMLGLIILLLLGLTGFNSFRDTLLERSSLWARATTGWQKDSWNPILVPDPAGTSLWKFRGNQSIGTVIDPQASLPGVSENSSLLEFHQALRDACEKKVAVPWVFAPFAHFGSDPNQQQEHAQTLLFEASVVRPLFEAAFAKMSEPQPDFPLHGKPDPRPVSELNYLEANALIALVQLEIQKLNLFPEEEAPGATYVPTLFEYVSGENNSAPLTDLMNWTYAKGDTKFPPAWLSNDPELIRAIRQGLARAIHNAEQAITERSTRLQLLRQLADSARNYESVETDLSQRANIKNDPATSDHEVATGFDKLREAKVDLEAKLAAAAQAQLFPPDSQTLSDSYRTLASSGEARLAVLRTLDADLEKVFPSPSPSPSPSASLSPLVSDYRVRKLELIEQTIKRESDYDPRYSHLREIKASLADIIQRIKTQVDAGVTPQQLDDFKSLDQTLLAIGANGQPLYLERWNLYQAARAVSPHSQFVSQSNLVGQEWRPLKNEIDSVESLRDRINNYNAPFKEPFRNTTNYLLVRAEDSDRDSFAVAYLKEVKTKLLTRLKFPLVWPPNQDSDFMTVAEIVDLRGFLDAVRHDLQSESFQKASAAARAQLTDFSKNLNKLYSICDTLVRADGSPCDITVTLLNGQAQRQLSGPDFAPPPTPDPTPTPPKRSLISRMLVHPKQTPTPTPTPYFNPRNWNSIELIGGSKMKASSKGSGLVPLDGKSDSNLGRFSADQPFHFRLFHTPHGGSSETVDAGDNWSAIRLLARFGAKPVDAGQYWRISLRPGEPTAVWVQIFFERPLPSFDAWPTLDTLGIRDFTQP